MAHLLPLIFLAVLTKPQVLMVQMIPSRRYHVLTTYGNGVQKIYIDGSLPGTLNRSLSALNKCSASQLVIGGWWQGDIISVDGKIHEMRIYNRVLSDCEIQKLTEI